MSAHFSARKSPLHRLVPTPSSPMPTSTTSCRSSTPSGGNAVLVGGVARQVQMHVAVTANPEGQR